MTLRERAARLVKGTVFASAIAGLVWVATGPLDAPVMPTTNASARTTASSAMQSPAVDEPDPSPTPTASPSADAVAIPSSSPGAAISAWDAWHSNWLVIPAVHLSVGVADFHDCSTSVLNINASAARNWCAFSPIVYLVGHNPGVFTPLLGLRAGDLVRYWDGRGHATTYRVMSINHTYGDEALPYMMDNSWPHLVLQTCAVLDGSQDWVYVAKPI